MLFLIGVSSFPSLLSSKKCRGRGSPFSIRPIIIDVHQVTRPNERSETLPPINPTNLKTNGRLRIPIPMSIFAMLKVHCWKLDLSRASTSTFVASPDGVFSLKSKDWALARSFSSSSAFSRFLFRNFCAADERPTLQSSVVVLLTPIRENLSPSSTSAALFRAARAAVEEATGSGVIHPRLRFVRLVFLIIFVGGSTRMVSVANVTSAGVAFVVARSMADRSNVAGHGLTISFSSCCFRASSSSMVREYSPLSSVSDVASDAP